VNRTCLGLNPNFSITETNQELENYYKYEEVKNEGTKLDFSQELKSMFNFEASLN